MTRRILAVLAVAIASILVSSSALAQAIPTHTFATLPGSPTAGQLAWLTDNSGTATEGSPAAGGAAPGNRDLVAYDAGQARWEFVLRVPATAPAADLVRYLEAIRVGYDNTASGSDAEDVQAALDELFASGGGGGGDLGTTATGSALTITNTGGTNASIPAATTTTWGALTDEDKTKLDGIEAGAAADQSAPEVPFTSTFSTWLSGNVRLALDYLFEMFQRTDADGNGLYESAYLWDADGDGSGHVVCTAKDTPDLACKALGEVIYRDWADDLNCAMHGCGFGQMELAGVIRHRAGVTYLNWPCYDASEPSGFNDPAAVNESLHDSTSDTAWGHCPQAPGFATNGRRLATVATMGWKGEILGAGSDPRDPYSTAGYKRDAGSYIADDRGPSWISGAQANLNSWFGMNAFIRGINFGFDSSPNVGFGIASMSGEWSGDGDSKGGGTISGDQALSSLDGRICVVDSNGWATALEEGDVIEVRGTSQVATFTIQTVIAALRVRANPVAGTCNGAGTIWVDIGGQQYDGTGARYSVDPPLTVQLTNGFAVVHARSDYRSNSVRFSGFTVMHQDSWNEPGGDCSGVGIWSSALDGTAAAVVPGGNADFDCDSHPLFGLFGGGDPVIQDIVIRTWHNHGIDGNSNVGSPRLSRLLYLRGQGGTILDPGTGWRADDLEIRESQFTADMIAGFGPGFKVTNLRILNSVFGQIQSFQLQNIANSFNGVRVWSSAFARLFNVACGARLNTVRDVEVSGHIAYGTSQSQGHIARFSCPTTSTPNELNSFADIVYHGPGLTGSVNGTGATSALFVFDADSVEGAENAAAIRNNSFRDIRYLNTESGSVSGCLFGVQDDGGASRATTPDYSNEDILAQQSFAQNSIRMQGPGTGRVYCQCGLFNGAGNSSPNTCDKPILGAGAGGADPRGCLNFEGTGAPAIESCF